MTMELSAGIRAAEAAALKDIIRSVHYPPIPRFYLISQSGHPGLISSPIHLAGTIEA